MRSIFRVLGAASVAYAASTVHQVTVGEGGALAYNPTEIFAAAGDQLQFIFYPVNHTVTQSSASSPCQPLAGGFYSGFVPTNSTAAATSFVVNVTSTDSIYFYSSQGTECQQGMIGIVNPLNITLSTYTTLASNVTKSTAPAGGPAGGLLETTATLTNGSTTTIISSAVPTIASTGSATGTTSGGVVAGTTTAASSTSTGIAAAITGMAGRDALFGIGAGVAVGLLGGWVM